MHYLKVNRILLLPVEIRFESFSATFQAIADDDTLTASLEALELDSDELLIDVAKANLGRGVLVQGYLGYGD